MNKTELERYKKYLKDLKADNEAFGDEILKSMLNLNQKLTDEIRKINNKGDALRKTSDEAEIKKTKEIIDKN